MVDQKVFLCHFLLVKCSQALFLRLKKFSLCNTDNKTHSLKCEESFS